MPKNKEELRQYIKYHKAWFYSFGLLSIALFAVIIGLTLVIISKSSIQEVSQSKIEINTDSLVTQEARVVTEEELEAVVEKENEDIVSEKGVSEASLETSESYESDSDTESDTSEDPEFDTQNYSTRDGSMVYFPMISSKGGVDLYLYNTSKESLKKTITLSSDSYSQHAFNPETGDVFYTSTSPNYPYGCDVDNDPCYTKLYRANIANPGVSEEMYTYSKNEPAQKSYEDVFVNKQNNSALLIERDTTHIEYTESSVYKDGSYFQYHFIDIDTDTKETTTLVTYTLDTDSIVDFSQARFDDVKNEIHFVRKEEIEGKKSFKLYLETLNLDTGNTTSQKFFEGLLYGYTIPNVAISSDLSKVALWAYLNSDPPHIYVYDFDKEQLIEVPKNGSYIGDTRLSWSADASKIFYATQDRIAYYDLNEEVHHVIRGSIPENAHPQVFSSVESDNYLLFAQNLKSGYTLEVYDIEENAITVLPAGDSWLYVPLQGVLWY